MRCPSCGAAHDPESCPQSVTVEVAPDGGLLPLEFQFEFTDPDGDSKLNSDSPEENQSKSQPIRSS